MPRPSQLAQLRRTISVARLDSIWMAESELTTPALRGALHALDHLEEELPQLPATFDDLPIWEQRVRDAQLTGFHYFIGETLFAFRPEETGWLCIKVDRSVTCDLAGQLLEHIPLWLPPVIREQLGAVRAVWRKPRELNSEMSEPQATEFSSHYSKDWEALLTEAIQNGNRLENRMSAATIEQLRFIQKNYVNENRHLNRLLNPETSRELSANLRIIEIQGFSIRDSEGLWVVRRQEEKWWLRRWSSKYPTEVKAFALTKDQFSLAGQSWTAERISTLFNQLTSDQAEVPTTASSISTTEQVVTHKNPAASLPETPPAAKTVETYEEQALGVTIPRYRWNSRLKSVLTTVENDVDNCSDHYKKVVLSQQLKSLRIIRSAHLSTRQELSARTEPTSQEDWATKVRQYAAKQFVSYGTNGLWFFKRQDAGFQVWGWDSRQPATVTERILTTLIHDPNDESWPPAELAQALTNAHQVLLLFPLETESGSALLNDSPQLSVPPISETKVPPQRIDGQNSDKNAIKKAFPNEVLSDIPTEIAHSPVVLSQNSSDLKLLLHVALENTVALDLQKATPDRTNRLNLNALYKHYVESNDELELLYQSGTAKQKLTGRKQFTVRTASELWFLRKGSARWRVLAWRAEEPQHVVDFLCDPFSEGGAESLSALIALLRRLTVDPPLSPLAVTRQEVEKTLPPSTRPLPRSSWVTAVKSALKRVDRELYSPQAPQARAELEQLQERLSWVNRALVNKKLLLPVRVDQRRSEWRENFLRSFGQQFTVQTSTGLCLFQRVDSGWNVLVWESAFPGEVKRIPLNSELRGDAVHELPIGVSDRIQVARSALQPIAPVMTKSSAPSESPSTGSGPSQADIQHWEYVISRRLNLLEQMSGESDAMALKLKNLQVIQQSIAATRLQLSPRPLDHALQKDWQAKVERCGLTGAFSILADKSVSAFRRFENGWQLYNWHLEKPGEVKERSLDQDLLDPQDDAWPPAELDEWLGDIALALQETTPRLSSQHQNEATVTAVPSQSSWLELVETALRRTEDTGLQIIQHALSDPERWLSAPPTGDIERVTWEDHVYQLGLTGEFVLLGSDAVWVFQRHEGEDWLVHEWKALTPDRIMKRLLDQDFLDAHDDQWPPKTVEEILGECAYELQGLPREQPAPKVTMWSGGGFRLFVNFTGDLSADGITPDLNLARGEGALAALMRHIRDGGILWNIGTGQEAALVQKQLAEHTLRTDILFTALTGQQPPEPPQKAGLWKSWLVDYLTNLCMVIQAAPDWQKHLLRGVWGVPETDQYGEAFFEHLEALEPYLDVFLTLQLDDSGIEQRLALLAVLSWLTRLDEEGETARFPYFDLHPQTHELARAIAHTPVRGESQLAMRVRSRFGLEAKPEQLQALLGLVERPGVHLLTLPTGGGKSLVYWTAADVLADLGGTTIVISPLQALITDQVREAAQHGLQVASLTSNRDVGARAAILETYTRGQTSLLYLTPEQLARFDVQQALLRYPPDLWVFDEAHTLTQWGMSFRPSYQQAVNVVLGMDHPNARVLLTSATITHEEQQALSHLFTPLGKLQSTGQAFTLPETLQIEVQLKEDENSRLAAIYEALERTRLARQQAIVYCTTPSQATALSERLSTFYPNHQIGVYHGQLSAEQRQQVSAEFLNKRYFCLVATSAFGLGVNNPDVRLVIHAYPPASIEDYVQQIGRATRLDEPAQALLLCDPRDLETQFRLQAQQLLQREDYRRVFAALREQARALPKHGGELWLSPLEIALLSRLEGETNQQRLKGELALHRLAADGVLRLNTLIPTPLTLSDTSDELPEDGRPELNGTANEIWQYLNQPTCDPSSVTQLVGALHLEPDVLLAGLCHLQDAGYLNFDYPIRVFINKGTKVGGLKASSARLFAAHVGLLTYLQSQETEDSRTYRLSVSQLLTMLNEAAPLESAWQRSDLQAALRFWELLGWAEAYLPDYSTTIAVAFRVDLTAAQVNSWLKDGSQIAQATAQLVELLYNKTRSAGRQLHIEASYQELNAALGSLMSPARLLNVLHRLRLLTLASGSDLRALGQTIEYLSGHQRTLQNLDYAGLQLDNARRFARVHLVERMLSCQNGEAVRAFVEAYFTTPLAAFFEQHFDLPLKEVPPCRFEELAKIKALSPAQARIVESSDRALLVVSGPGSGKTRTVVHRVAHLLRVERIPATRVLVVAFNRAAVRELRQRLFELVGTDALDLDIYTFHALALRILNVNLADLARETGKNKSEALSQALATALEQLQSEDQVDGEERALLESFKGRYDYILIDEYQDIDLAQYELVRLLVGHGQGEDREKAKYNLWAVGDDDQTLYQFRGARPEFLQQFEKEYETRRQVLVENYRSLPGITEVANQLISRSAVRTKVEAEEQVRPVRSSVDSQPEVLYHELKEVSPRSYLVNEIVHLLATNKSIKPEDIAVLAPRWVDLAPAWATVREMGIQARMLRSGTVLAPFPSTHVQKALGELNRRASGLRKGYLLHEEISAALGRAALGQHAPGIRRMLLAGKQLDEERRLTGLLDKPVLVKSLLNDLQEVLIEPEDIDEGGAGITFSTFHSAKGLEFKIVFVLGSKPFYSTKLDRQLQWEAHLRSHYVAMTRAEDLLYLVDLPGQGCEFISKPGSVPSIGIAPTRLQQRLPQEGTVQLTFDHYGDLNVGHRSTLTKRVQNLLTTLEEAPLACQCKINWQFNRSGPNYRVLEFLSDAGQICALSKGATRELLQIFPDGQWKGVSAQLLEATTFTPDDGEPYLVPIVDLQVRTTFQ